MENIVHLIDSIENLPSNIISIFIFAIGLIGCLKECYTILKEDTTEASTLEKLKAMGYHLFLILLYFVFCTVLITFINSKQQEINNLKEASLNYVFDLKYVEDLQGSYSGYLNNNYINIDISDIRLEIDTLVFNYVISTTTASQLFQEFGHGMIKKEDNTIIFNYKTPSSFSANYYLDNCTIVISNENNPTLQLRKI